MNKILVIEDDKKIANILKVYLEDGGFKVIHADKGGEGLDLFLKESPSIVILDLMLPDKKGEELLQEIKEINDTPVILLTAKSAPEERVAGFALGADDYVTKPFNPRELVFRVRAILKRLKKITESPNEILSFNNGTLIIDGNRFEVRKNGEIINLTPTEFKILFTLAVTPEKVFSREELIEKALGYDFDGMDRSIDVHIKNIRHKIENDPKNPELILTVYKVGYKFIGTKDA